MDSSTFLLILLVVLVAGSLVASRWHSRKPESHSCKLLVVLGSGGHTAEMIQLLDTLDVGQLYPRVYVVADNDHLSVEKVLQWERTRHDILSSSFQFVSIPRARNVGQSLLTALFPTLRSLWTCLDIARQYPPSIALCNGPGTCLPILLAIAFFRLIKMNQCHLVYIESFARVNTLSLTGRLVYHLVDTFVVQWPRLLARYPRATYLGFLV